MDAGAQTRAGRGLYEPGGEAADGTTTAEVTSLDVWNVRTKGGRLRDNGSMTSTQRLILWGSTVALGVALVVVGVFLGLEEASMLGGILGAIAGMTGVIIGTYQLRNVRATPNATPRQSQRSGNNSVNIQSGNDLNIGDSNRFRQP